MGTRRDGAKRLRTVTTKHEKHEEDEEDEMHLPELPEDAMRLILNAAMSSPSFMTYGTLCELSESSAMMARLTAARRGEMREELRHKVRACLFGGGAGGGGGGEEPRANTMWDSLMADESASPARQSRSHARSLARSFISRDGKRRFLFYLSDV